jgi:hypothetical protein
MPSSVVGKPNVKAGNDTGVHGPAPKRGFLGKSDHESDRNSLPKGNPEKDTADLNNLEFTEFNRFSSPCLHSFRHAMRIDANS